MASVMYNGQTSAPVLSGTPVACNMTSEMGAQEINSYDPARISQWAAHSATGPSTMLEHDFQEHCNFDSGNHSRPGETISQMIPQFSASPSGICYPFDSHVDSLSYSPALTDQERLRGSAGAHLHMDQGIPSDPEFGFPSVFDGPGYNNGLSTIDGQAYPAFVSGDSSCFSPMEADQTFFVGNETNGQSSSLPWAAASEVDVTQPLEWSPTSGLTPSSSSVPSSHGFLGHQPDTPISGTLFDGTFPANHNESLNGDNGIIPSFNLGDMSTHPSSTMNFVDPDRFVFLEVSLPFDESNPELSTIRPSQNFRRAPISLDTWTAPNGPGQLYGLPMAYTSTNASRRSSEGDAKNARDHAFYKATPRDDGLYHCPYTAMDTIPESEKCKHKPDKLKCNYDKHLDSHLKPYRCKSYGCAQIQFSSTACLLRHEREAHGMHGHGPKPHLCFFKDCERAQEDNGFPRRWNLFDHMKRVHDFAGTEPSNRSNSPSSTSSPEPCAELRKKKRTPSPANNGTIKKAKVTNSGRTSEQTSRPQTMIQTGSQNMVTEYPSQSLNQMWYDHAAQVQARLRSLDPTDPRQWKQYQADTATLQNIGWTIQYQQQAQLAH
ncbi:hypothetical protein ACLMJK_006448 [Lecanora helva]